MKKGGGKAKGSNWERECCKTLSLWISNGQRDDLLWREATKKRGQKVTQSGDITAIHSLGEDLTGIFCIECKAYKNIHLESLVYDVPVKGSMISFWEQVNRDSVNSARKPMLIAKQNSKPVIVGLPLNYKMPISPVAVFPKYGMKLFFFTDVINLEFKDFIK